MLHANVLIVCFIQIISLINCFSQVANAGNCEKIKGIFVLYAFLSKFHYVVYWFVLDTVLWPMLAFYTFYKGYYTVCNGPNHELSSKIYYAAQIFQCVLFFIFTIIHSGAMNGFTKLPILNECDLGFSVFLSVVEIILYYLTIAIGVFSLLTIQKNYGQKQPYLPKD